METIQIPDTAGAILLPNCVTFPHGALPLHIFEPRYRKMLDDALAGNFLMCVANLKTDETPDPSRCTSKTGTIGLIRASRLQEDGRSHLILHAITRVEFLNWENNSLYPRADIKPIPNIAPPLTEATKLTIASLRHATSQVLAQFPPDVVQQLDNTLDRVNADLAILTDIIAQQFVGDPQIRQSLLEQQNPLTRAESLIRHLRTQN